LKRHVAKKEGQTLKACSEFFSGPGDEKLAAFGSPVILMNHCYEASG
jgi:hypothetical protein